VLTRRLDGARDTRFVARKNLGLRHAPLVEIFRERHEHGTAGRRLGQQQAVRDPFVNALHRTLLEREPRARSERLRLDGLIARLQEGGPGALGKQEQRDLLCDPASMAALHALAWDSADGAARVS